MTTVLSARMLLMILTGAAWQGAGGELGLVYVFCFHPLTIKFDELIVPL